MMNNKDLIIMKTPASSFGKMWREGLPIGNGELGAILLGGIKKESVIVNHCDLWHWGERSELPDVSYTLEKSRTEMDNHNHKAANDLLSNELKEKGYNSKSSMPFPFLNLVVGFSDGMFSKYRRILNMQTAEAIVEYNQNEKFYKRKTFVSSTDNVLVYKASVDKGTIAANINLQLYDDGSSLYRKKVLEIGENLDIKTDGSYIYFTSKNDNGEKYGAVLKILDGELNDKNEIITKNNEFNAILKVFVRNNGTIQSLKEEIDSLPQNYDELLNRHLERHKKLYNCADISLSDENSFASTEELLLDAYDDKASNLLLEKMWRFGRYLSICGTSEKYPMPLYGLWNGEYAPVWSQNVANENVQIIHWHLSTGGLIELSKGLIEYYFSKIEDFKNSAKCLFGCNGIYVSTYTTPFDSLPNPVVPVIMNWIGGAGWISQHFYEYYLVTKDEKILFEKILPFMIEAANFYEDYVVIDKGEAIIYPSVSPENSPANFIVDNFSEHMSHPMPAVKNATMDFAIIKELLTNLLSVSKQYSVNVDKIEVWQNILNVIPNYQINSDGAIKEWMDEELKDFYCHRHLSHLYPVFPGKEVNDSSELFEAFKKAVDLRELGGQSGWSLAHMASIYARFMRGEDSINCIDTLIKGATLNNLFAISNDYRDMGITMSLGQFAPVQLDANLGIVNGIQEMLLYVGDNFVKFIPALPNRFKNGKVTDFCFYGGIVSFKWDVDEEKFSACIKANENLEMLFILPNWNKEYKITFGGNEQVELIKNTLKVKLCCDDEINVFCN